MIGQFFLGLLILAHDKYKQTKRRLRWLLEDSPIRIYFGTPGWGWSLYGIGWKSGLFFGLSIKEARNGD